MTVKATHIFTLVLLAIVLPLSLSAQYVYTRAYRHNVQPLAMTVDSLSLVSVGTIGGHAFGFTKMDSSGQIIEALAYRPANIGSPSPIPSAALRLIHRHPSGGYILAGQGIRNANHLDSARLVVMHVTGDGLPIWARSYRWSNGLGGHITGLDILGDGSIAIAGYMYQNNTSQPIVGMVAKLDPNGQIDWFRYHNLANNTAASFVPIVRNNLSLNQNDEILTGWNVATGGPLNIQRGFALRTFDPANGNVVWKAEYSAHKLLTLDHTPNNNGLAAYIEDTSQVKKLVKFDATGAIQYVVNDAYQNVTDRAVRIKAVGNRIPYLYANRLTLWQPTPNNTPEALRLPFSTHRVVTDFYVRGSSAYFVGYRQTANGRIPTLSKAAISDTVANCFFRYDPSNNYSLGSLDTLIMNPTPSMILVLSTDSLNVQTVPLSHISRYECVGEGLVWPGDANSDGVANVVDVLFLGLAWNETGPARANPSVQWQGFPAINWNSSFFNGANKKHADCNGNGHVGIADFGAILLNYGLTHNKGDVNGAPTDPPLNLRILNDTVAAGDTVHAEIWLGSDTIPVPAIHGVAFNIGYNPMLVDTNSFAYHPIDSWLGSDNVDMVYLDNEIHNEGVYQVGITRTDQTDVGGYGLIGKVSFVTIDDIAGKTDVVEMLQLSINTLDAFDNLAEPQSLYACSDSVVVVQQDASTAIEAESLLSGVNIYPNPSSEQFSIASQNVFTERIRLMDLQGRIVLQQSVMAHNAQISVAQLPSGVYLLRGDSPNGVWMEKLIIQ